MQTHRVIGALLGAALLATPQQIFRSDTQLVQVEVTVRNDKGPIDGLTKDDFQLFDNGLPQKIAAFNILRADPIATPEHPLKKIAPVPEAPSTEDEPKDLQTSATVFFIDNLGAPFVDQLQSRHRIAEILNSLPPREPVAVFKVNQELRKITDFTNDPVRIAKALAQAPGEQSQPPASCDGDYRDRVPCAELLGLEKVALGLMSIPGRKSLLWISNMFPIALSPEANPILRAIRERTVRELNQADVAVMPIYAAGLTAPAAYSAERSKAPPIGINPSRGLTGLAGEYWAENTGGAASMINTDVGGALQRALDANRITYVLGFYPETLDGAYHELKVNVDHANVDVSNRKGYFAKPPGDLVAGKIAGQALETRAAAVGEGSLYATMQTPYFYAGTNRARIHLALEVVPAAMEFKKENGKLHGQIEVVGSATRTSGDTAARFAETTPIDQEDQIHADAFTQAPWRYEHQFSLAPGNYMLQIAIGAGTKATGKISAPLNIEPWNSANFGIGGIAFSTTARTVDPDNTLIVTSDKLLIAAGRQFIPSATSHFQKSDRVYFYTELYEPALTAPQASVLSLQYRVLDRATSEVRLDSGIGGVSGYVHPGSSVVPFATALPIAKLEPGSYRLEIRATHSSGPEVVNRTVDFDVK